MIKEHTIRRIDFILFHMTRFFLSILLFFQFVMPIWPYDHEHVGVLYMRLQFDFSIERQCANCRNDRFKFTVEIDF